MAKKNSDNTQDSNAIGVAIQRLVRPSAFVLAAMNPAAGPTPVEALLAAVKQLEDVAYARGFDAALSRLEMLSAVMPESVTKAQLVEMLKREVTACIGAWNAKQRPNVPVSGGANVD